MSLIQEKVIESLNGLSEDDLNILYFMITHYMQPAVQQKPSCRIGMFKGEQLISKDFDIDEDNDLIAKMFGVA